VPYGEYLPMRGCSRRWACRDWCRRFRLLVRAGPRTLDLGAGPAARGVQICYEIVFSGQVVDRAHRPALLFNPTNDGWFGAWGPPQHLAQARLRAIEEGLPVLRATTNGISR
jgi:apolipoprotein N-acyltransferase